MVLTRNTTVHHDIHHVKGAKASINNKSQYVVHRSFCFNVDSKHGNSRGCKESTYPEYDSFVSVSAEKVKQLIANSPICGVDAESLMDQCLVKSEPADDFYCEDNVSAGFSSAQTGVLIIHDDVARGKSAVANITARARTQIQPSKFLVVSNGKDVADGNKWFSEIARSLGAPAATPHLLSDILCKAFDGA